MSQKTYSQLSAFVQKKLDLQEENFITAAELLEACEEAITYCEAEIHKLNIEDQYFVACANLRIESGKQTYSLPSNMYANKILKVMYTDGVKVYPVKRLTGRDRFSVAEELRLSANSTDLWYMLENNDVNTGTLIRFYPIPNETSQQATPTATLVAGSRSVATVSSTAGVAVGHFVSGTGIALNTRVQSVNSATSLTLDAPATTSGTGVTLTINEPRIMVWYIRRANIPASSTDVIDFPEFWSFISQHMIVECLDKEIGNPRLQKAMAKLQVLQEQMQSTLSNMVPDQEDKLEMDMSSYVEQDSEGMTWDS